MAERREELQAQLTDARTAARTNPETALGASDTLAALIGGDKARIATIISVAMTIAMLIILELIATFSGDGATMLRKALIAHPPRAVFPPEQALGAAATAPAKPAKSVANRAYYLSRLERGVRNPS